MSDTPLPVSLNTAAYRLAIVTAAVAAGRLLAQDTASSADQPYRLDTMVVTAAGGQAQPNDGAATSLSGAELGERGILSPRELSGILPNVATFDANGDRNPRFSIRGLRENNFSYGEAATVVYVDDVPFFDLYTRGLPLFGVDSVEVFRGPQPTVFGANRPGGVINVLTRLPANDFRGNGTVRYGNYDAVSAEGGVSGPIVKDQLFAGFSGLYQKREGYFDNLVTGNDPDHRETLAGRGQLRWTPTENLDLAFTMVADQFNDGGVISRPLAAPGDLYDLKADQDGTNEISSQQYSLRAAWTGEWIKAISITTRRVWRQDVRGDFDYAEYQPNPLLPPGFYVPIRVIEGYSSPDVSQWAQELRFESPDRTAALKWNFGAFWSEHVLESDLGYVYGPDAAAAFGSPFPLTGLRDQTLGAAKDQNFAGFGQATYTFWDNFDVTAGLRWEYDDRQVDRQHSNPLAPPPFNSIAFNQRTHWDALQAHAALAYHFNPDCAIWFRATEGYQPGGFSLSQDDPTQSAYGEAQSQHYELGGTAKFFESKLVLSANGFYTRTDDYQVYRPLDALGRFDVLNADTAESIGAELEARIRPVKGLEFAVAAGFTRAEFLRFTAPDPAGGPALVLDGNRINFVPEFTLDASATYRWDCGAFASIGVTALGDYFFDERNTTRQDAYALLRARVGWENDHIGVALFGRNLTDTEFYANALDLGPRQGFVGTPGDPMILGIEITGRF